MNRGACLGAARAALLCLGLASARPVLAEEPAEAKVLYEAPPAPGTVVVPPPTTPSAAASTPATDSDEEGGIAGWFPDEGFVIKSRDGQNKLHVGLQAGYRFQPHWVDGHQQDRSAFFVLRPVFSGTLFKEWISFWTSLELANNPGYLLDAFVDIAPWKQFGVRIGQQYSVVSRHEYSGPQQVLFPDWSSVANYFWPGRDKGITAMGSSGDGTINYWAGAYVGAPLRQMTTLPDTWNVAARVTLNPMGPVADDEVPYINAEEPVPSRFSINFASMAGDYISAQENFNPGSFQFDVVATNERRKQQMGLVDLWLQGPRYVALVEGYVRRSDYNDQDAYVSSGVWGQLGYMVVDRLVDIGARFQWLNASNHLKNDKAYSLEGMVGYYPFRSTHLMVKARYGYGKQEAPADDEALGHTALLFVPGTNHLLTLQLTLAI